MSKKFKILEVLYIKFRQPTINRINVEDSFIAIALRATLYYR